MPFVQVADVSDDMKLVDDTKQKISKLAQPMSVCAEEGSVLVTLQGSIGRVAIMQYKAFVDRTVLIFDKYNADIDKTFWAYIIKEKFIEEARKAPGGTIKTITKEVLSDFDLMLPSYDEQKMLGKLLHSLDHLITLHQREFAFLCKEKSKKFRYIKNAWEQRKFGEVFDCTVPNNTLSRAELSYDEGTVLNVHYGDVLIKYGSVLDVQKDDIPRIPHRCREDFNGALLQDGDVIIADTAEDETTGKACEIGNLQGSAIVSGLHTMVCRPRNRMALGYLGYYLNSNAYHYQLLPLMQGIKVLSLSRSNIQKTSVSYPSAMKEQQLIASYFSQLDHLITLHQRKPNFYTGGYYAE